MKPGYKQTEVGVIPEEWEVKPLSAISSMKSGEAITASRINDHSQYPCYGGNGLRGFTSSFTHNGSFALIGRQGALCGNVVGVSGKLFASEHAVVVTPRQSTNIQFLTYVLREMHLNRLSEASAQPGLSVSKILQLSIAIPPTEDEQRAIAAALSDVDALLCGLERLITKKRDLKQAAMQQLLTGQTRLPGFDGAWEVKTIGAVCQSYSGGTPSTTKPEFYGGEIPFIRSAEIARNKTELSLTSEGLINSSAKMITKGDVLVALYGANSGDVALATIDGAINQAILCLKSEESNAFLYQFLSFKKNWIVATFIQGGQGNLSGEIIKSITLSFPPLSEQIAIAAVLSDMDAELVALEQRRTKTRALKQAMMQELLTGRIRLIARGDAENAE